MINYTDEELRWLNGLAEFDQWNERLMMATLAYYGLRITYLDVGSGDGAMVNTARKLGVDAWGIDILPREEECLITHDLRQPIDLGRRFDLITSLEVAEHIPPENAETYIDTVVRHLAPGGTLLFTAARPGQAGDGHVNCQPAEYWRKAFHDRGASYAENDTHRIALLWKTFPHPMQHLLDNLQVFKR